MNLKPVNPEPQPGQRLLCASCGKMKEARKMFADLDGEPFKAYYCSECTQVGQAPEGGEQ